MSGAVEETGDDGDPRDLLAAEFVLGTLEPAERLRVEAERIADPGLAAAIEEWEQRLAPAALMAPEVALPPALWPRLAAAIGAGAMGAPAGAESIDRLRRWRRRAGMASAAALAFAAAFAAAIVLPRPAPSPGVVSIASLAPLNAAGPVFLATLEEDGSIRLRPVQVGQVPTGKSLELWALAAGSKTPVPLGVIDAAGLRTRAPGPVGPGTQLLVSVEPQGGSPTGAPTGPVLYGGTLTAR